MQLCQVSEAQNQILTLSKEKLALEQLVLKLSLENLQLKGAEDNSSRKLFSDFMLEWLEIHKMQIQETTYRAYETQIKLHIVPYFKKTGISLKTLTPMMLQKYYSDKIEEGISPNTVHKHHANIHSALTYAVRNNLIHSNPADNVDKPKLKHFTGDFLDSNKLNELYKLFSQTKIYTPVLLAGTMGLRRSEILGLKWNNIDFGNSTLTVVDTAVKILKNGRYEILLKDCPKNRSSYRTLPIPNKLLEYLHDIKSKQVVHYMQNAKQYNKNFLQNVCVDEYGSLFMPDILSNTFSRTLISNNFKKIRFHDLRHSCASNLLAMGYSLKDIQEWLGHSTIATTSNIYTHIDFERKIGISKGIDQKLDIP